MRRLYLIGAGTPTPAKDRFGTCLVLQADEQYLMIDCGPAATQKLVNAGLFPTQIDTILFTHHHFDHNADYACFALSRWNQSAGNEKPLRVLGPEPTERVTDRLIGPQGAFVDDYKARTGAGISQQVYKNRGGTLPRPEPKIDARDIGSGPVGKLAGWDVSAVGVHHVEPFLASLAYRFDCPAGRIVIAGDTGSVDTIVKFADRCDVLVVNCWGRQSTLKADGEDGGMAGTIDAAEMARRCGAETLILTHLGKNLHETNVQQTSRSEIAEVYKGNVVFACEGMAVDLF